MSPINRETGTYMQPTQSGVPARAPRFDAYTVAHAAPPPVQRPQRTQPQPPMPRRSKAESLQIVHHLKQGIVAASILGFGTFGALAAAHQSVTHTSATTSNAAATSTATSQPSSNGGFFGQQPGGSDSGNFGSSSSAAPVSGSGAS